MSFFKIILGHFSFFSYTKMTAQFSFDHFEVSSVEQYNGKPFPSISNLIVLREREKYGNETNRDYALQSKCSNRRISTFSECLLSGMSKSGYISMSKIIMNS